MSKGIETRLQRLEAVRPQAANRPQKPAWTDADYAAYQAAFFKLRAYYTEADWERELAQMKEITEGLDEMDKRGRGRWAG